MNNDDLIGERSGLKTFRALVRILFGLVWVVDAAFKWSPVFFREISSMVNGAMLGQNEIAMPWFMYWGKIVSSYSFQFALFVAVVESLIAISVLFGVAKKLGYVGGALFSLLLWTIPDGFGGPYVPGSTDIGASIIYVFVFALLLLVDATLGSDRFSMDYYLERKISWWKNLAVTGSKPIQHTQKYTQ
ncbi:MAG: hypothetical protein M1290_05555 [Candidatus Thermoplasmatota archaeon]|jgi:uncharacterized membrane protein YphA (DoxX/SURF4 family)|nr:hypothetical protein [Candidatus Thermoplasmatota archaeon]MCL5789911.1 hypothetical protein [Candidatus Thermoplasmatota archaeon]